MNMLIFAVRDRATDQFGTPMFLISRGHAIRSFQDEVNRAADENMIYRHPEDFDLYQLGTFDTVEGTFQTSVPSQVAIGKDMVVKK